MPFSHLTIGKDSPEIINVIIEISKGSQNKYEYDEKQNVLKLDRVLYSPMHYPLDYGFIPETRSEDGDHLDALVIGNDPVFAGCLVEIRPIGMMKMIDSGDPDAKILGVQAKNPRFDNIKDLKDIEKLNPHLLKEIAHFFEKYKDLQNKKVTGIEWLDKKAALTEIKKSQKAYTK